MKKTKKTYSVTEHADKWKVSAESGKLLVFYDVSKELCSTADELRNYVLSNEMF